MAGADMGKKVEIQHALKNGAVLIYGAHLVALELYRYLKSASENLKIDFLFEGFAVTAARENPEELEGQKVAELQSSQAPREATVMIAMPEKYHQEAEDYARKLGFSSFVRVSLEEMSRLKGRQMLCDHQTYMELGICLREDAYDTSWLNAYVHQEDPRQNYSPADCHFKFPTLYYLDEAERREAGKFDFRRDYERLFGPYRNLHALCAPETPEEIGQMLHLYMVFSQWDSVAAQKEYPDWIRPIQAGSICSEQKSGGFLDETGDSISGKNRTLAEMTAAYWIWKNAEPVKYKGLCHYRRHFLLSEKEVKNLERNGVDVILTTPRYAPEGIRRMFLAETPVKEPVYQTMQRAVAECHPEDVEALAAYLEECLYCPNNMVIARSEIYDAYCGWMFPILFRMMELEEKSGYGHEEDRHIAYAAELLTSCFFMRSRGKYRVAVTDYEFCA